MRKDEMIIFGKENPGVKITHRLFDPEEFLYFDKKGNVYDELGYLFEDFHSKMSCGLRIRTDESWEYGWYVVLDSKGTVCDNLINTELGRAYLTQLHKDGKLCTCCTRDGRCEHIKNIGV